MTDSLSSRHPSLGIPHGLDRPLRETLVSCQEFATAETLRAVLAHEWLMPWKDSIPITDSVAGRVDLVLSYLVDQYRTTGENALVLFLSALAENYDPATPLHGQLLDLAMSLAEAKLDKASLGRLQGEGVDLEAEAARKNTPLDKTAEGTASAPASAEASAGAIAHIPSSLPAWIDRLLHLWLWLYYLVFVSGVVLSFVANLGSTLGLSSCVQQRMLTALVFMGGAVILGLSFLPKLKANYRNWDRMVTACLCLMVTTVSGYLSNAACALGPIESANYQPTSTPSPIPFSISFGSLDDANMLNPDLQWDAGSSEASLYTLSTSTDTIRLTAGPHTWPNFPTISYKQPIGGNFDVQLKVVFGSPVSALSTTQSVGLLIRPIGARLVVGDESFPMDWVVAAKSITDAGTSVGCCRSTQPDYSLDTVYLKIERVGDIWRCAYSENGQNWTWFNVSVDSQSLHDKQLEVALFAYSATNEAITAEFSDWHIIRKQ